MGMQCEVQLQHTHWRLPQHSELPLLRILRSDTTGTTKESVSEEVSSQRNRHSWRAPGHGAAELRRSAGRTPIPVPYIREVFE
jgi:hypothetical protein